MQLPQPCGMKLKTDGELNGDDAKFGKVPQVFGMSGERQRKPKANDDTSYQLTKHVALP